MLEKGLRQPSLACLEKLVATTSIPLDKWLSTESSSDIKEAALLVQHEAELTADLKKKLNHERRKLKDATEWIWGLEQVIDRQAAEICLHRRFGLILCSTPLSKGERAKKLEELVIRTMKEGELTFDVIQGVLTIKRSVMRNWLEAKKQPYECRFADGGKIMAYSPGEAALCLRCFDCREYETKECFGHGEEKRPENIVELLERLRVNGVYDGSDQAHILEKYYGLALDSHNIANIRYRVKNSLSIPDEVFYLDMQ